MASLLNIKGGAELQRALQGVPVKLERKILRGALRAAAKVIEAEAKRRVPVRTGRLRDSIRVSAGAKKNGRVWAHVKAGGGRKGRAFYAHFVEFGTRRHIITAGAGRSGAARALSIAGRLVGAKVDHPGAQERPFMRPALDTQAQAAIDDMAAYIRARLAQAIR